MTSQLRELAVTDSINSLLFGLEFTIPNIPIEELNIVLDVLCSEFALSDLAFNEGAQSGNTRTFDLELSLDFLCNAGLNINPTVGLSLPLEFTSSDFENIAPSVALQDSFSCSESLVLNGLTNGIDAAFLGICELEGADIIGEIIAGLNADLFDVIGPAVQGNTDFDTDLQASIDNLENIGFRVLDDEVISELLDFFVDQFEEIDFIQDFIEVIQDPDSDFEDIFEALGELLEEFDIDIEDYYGDYYDFDFSSSRKLLKTKKGRRVQADSLPQEIQDLIALLPAELQGLITDALLLNEDFQNILLEGTVEQLIIELDGQSIELAAIVGALFSETDVIDLLSALVQFDIAAVIGLIDLQISTDLVIGLLVPPEVIALLFPQGIPADFGEALVNVVSFVNDRLNGLVITAGEPLSQAQIEILVLVALFDPLIAENINRIQAGEVDGSEFFGFLQIERFEFELEGNVLAVEPQTISFVSDIQLSDVESAVLDIGLIQTPTFNVNTFIITSTVEVITEGTQDLVTVEIDLTAVFKAAAGIVAGDDLTDIGFFGVEQGSDLAGVGADALNCAASNIGFSLLATEQSFTVSVTTSFADEADAGLQNLINGISDLYAAALQQLVGNALKDFTSEAQTFEGDSDAAAQSCLATSISANNEDDNLGLILGVVGAVVAVAAIAGIIALIVVKNKKTKEPEIPVANVVPTKAGAVPDEGKQKTGVSF